MSVKEKIIQPIDHAERDLAVSQLDKNILVLAGAGTGKTRILIDRIVLLITQKEISVDRIVALTFTKKAAEEMRVRLEEKLREIIESSETDPRVKERAARALNDIPKAQIGTIHSFAGHLLRLFPIQAHVDPKFREDDGDLFDQIFEELWKEFLVLELQKDAPRAQSWRSLLRVVDLSDLKLLAQELCAPDVEIKNLDHQVCLGGDAAEWRNDVENLLRTNPLSARSAVFKSRIEALIRVLDDKAHARPIQTKDIDSIRQISTTKLPGVWNEKQTKDKIKRIRRRALSLVEINDELIEKALKAVMPLVNKIKSELNRRGAISFQGLLLFARNLVRDHINVRKSIKKQFDAFLVDEFQDTDPLQGEILFYLAEHEDHQAKHWKKVSFAPGKIFLVGDPKQSIYRFRGADIAAFEAFQKKMKEQNALEIVLGTNFRSDPEIIEAVNHIFSIVIKPKRYLQPPYLPLTAFRSVMPGPSIEMKMMESPEDESQVSAESYRLAEAEWIGSWIQAHVGPDKAWNFKDITLLFRSSNAFGAYIDIFKKKGIPYLVEGEKYFYKTPEVMEFINLVAAISNPDDQLALVGVLRSPVGGLTDREILELKNAEGFDYRKPPPRYKEKIGNLFEHLKAAWLNSSTTPVPDLISTILRKTYFMEIAGQSTHGEQAVANIMKIRALALKWLQNEPLTLTEYVKRIRNYQLDEREEGENPLADAHYNAVKVMTIHKAKGLEFPVVFLPNLSAGTRNFAQHKPVLVQDWKSDTLGLRLPRTKIMNTSMHILEEEISEREAAEERRVFYVAMTRAKDKLILLGRSGRGGMSDFIGYLGESKYWPHKFESVPWTGIKTERRSPGPGDLLKQWDPLVLANHFKLKDQQYIQAQSFKRVTSPTRQHNEQDKWRVVDEDNIHVPVNSAISIGLICHKVLEGWDFKGKNNLSELVQSAGHIFEVFDAEVIAEAHDILKQFIKSEIGQKLGRVDILGREIPFIYPHQEGAQLQVMRGVIDLIYEEQGKIIIADYKTSRNKDASSYQTQGQIYQQAILGATGKKADFEVIFLRSGDSARI